MTKAKRNTAATAVYLLLCDGDRVLLSLRKNTGYQDGMWQVPAGHIDAGELPTEALYREAMEEAGIRPIDPVMVHASFRPKHDETGDRVDYFFVAKAWEGKITNCEPEKCAELNWFPIQELPENTTPHVQNAIEAALLKGECFSELSLLWMQKTGAYDIE